jgi:hypothetical protein
MYAFIYILCLLFPFRYHVFFFLKKKRKPSQSPSPKRSVHSPTSSSVCDHVMNLEKNYEEKPNVEVVDQSSTIEEISGMPLLIESTTCKWIM